ncbi:MAG: hypothetical protein V2I51_22305 [Anderseniella sp.]|nr:hypothetical protein [Anderseniella sp.]
MTDSSSHKAPGVTALRWIARLVSIPWAYCALGLAWWVAAYGLEEGKLSPMAVRIIVCIVCLLTLGAAILAGVWLMESFGGKVLLADGALIFVWVLVTPQLPDAAIILAMAPVLAGALFLECHRRLKGGRTDSDQQGV